MKQKPMKRASCRIAALVLTCALILNLCACGSAADSPAPATTQPAAEQSVGEGALCFTLEVTHADGSEKRFTVNADAGNLGRTLETLGLIAGEDGPYGLYVKTVDGESVDYERDGKYWALYVDGAYANGSVDAYEITDGAVYAFRAE